MMAQFCWCPLALALSTQVVAAQDQSRGWLPREVHAIRGVSPAQRVEAMATLDKIVRLLKQVPELANPDGYEILPIIDGGNRQEGPGSEATPLPGSVVEYGIGLRHHRPTRAIAPEGSVCIGVTVNQRQHARMRDAQGRGIYIEGERGKPSTNPNISDSRVPHATQVYGELWNVPRERSSVEVLFVTAGELPWKPVSRETFYQATLLEQEGKNGEKMAEFRAGLKTTPYEEWIKGAAQRKKDREASFAQLAGIVPAAEIEKLRQTQENTEREVTERLKKDEEQHRDQNATALTKSFGMRDGMQAELAQMTPDERRMPTYINNALTEGPNATGWRLTTDEAPPAWRVLTPNDDFYRARRSPVEVRSISVSIGMSRTCLAPKIQAALWKAFHTLDWGAFNNLLEQPR